MVNVLEWGNVGYIEQLMEIEKYIIRSPRFQAEGIRFFALKKNFPEEYHAMKIELCPGWEEEDSRRKEEEKRRKMGEENDRNARMIEELKKEKENIAHWKSLGGKF